MAEVSKAFLRALDKTLEWEGGYSHHPADAGGPTYHGVTQRVYDAYRRTTGQAGRSVEFMSEMEERVIYHDSYWLPINGDALPEPLSHAVFDMAVNSGVWNAKIALQEAVRVKTDGVIGPVTAAACNATPNVLLVFLKKRAEHIRDIVQAKPAQVVFLLGWVNRLLEQAYGGAK